MPCSKSLKSEQGRPCGLSIVFLVPGAVVSLLAERGDPVRMGRSGREPYKLQDSRLVLVFAGFLLSLEYFEAGLLYVFGG